MLRKLHFPVTVTWEGTLVTGPILIYHDEVRFDGNSNPMLGNINGPGALVCRSQTRPRAGWRRVDTSFFEDTDSRRSDINQIRNGPNDVPNYSRLSRGTTNPANDNFVGLLMCQVNAINDEQDVIANLNFVGFYRREPGTHITKKRCRSSQPLL